MQYLPGDAVCFSGYVCLVLDVAPQPYGPDLLLLVGDDLESFLTWSDQATPFLAAPVGP